MSGFFASLFTKRLSDDEIVSYIRAAGWRQGSIVEDELQHSLRRQFLPHVGAMDWLIVVSHDCDLVHGSTESEPYVELLRAHSVRESGQSSYGKNPRRIAFEIVDGTTRILVEASVHDRCRIPRGRLARHRPSAATLTPDTRDMISRWLAKRYVRAAFPDAFNERVNGQRKSIEKALKKDGEHLSGIYLLLSTTDELSDEHFYTIEIAGTMRVDAYENADARKAADRAMQALGTAVRNARGIVVTAISLQSEDEFSLDDARVMLRWDYDALSWRSGGELPHET